MFWKGMRGGWRLRLGLGVLLNTLIDRESGRYDINCSRYRKSIVDLR